MNAEQNCGLLGEYAGAAGVTPEPGGPPDRWRELTPYARTGPMALRVGADPSYLYLALEGGRPVAAARYVVGIDTYRPDRGQFRLPGLPSVPSEVGFELALVLDDTSDAQLLVARHGPEAPQPELPRSGEHTSELQSRPHLACRTLPPQSKHRG